MDPGVNKTADSSRAAAVPIALLPWPAAVQLALVLIVTAGVFYFLGRWSQEWSHVEARPVAAREVARPALDLNRATKAELRLLPGLGDTLAQRVFDYRQRIGQFKSVDELRQVSGIGPKTLDRLRPHLFVTPLESFVADDEGETMPAELPRIVALGAKASKLTEPINVNHADQAGLQKLPGIGPKLSQRILDERAKAHFKTIDELRRVAGIGPKTLEKLRPHVTIE